MSTYEYQLLRLRDVVNLNPIEWMIDGVIPKGATVLLYGEPGVGKTFVALSMAAAIAAGIPWCGLNTTRGSSVYIAGEGLIDLGMRAQAWTKLHQTTNELDLWFMQKPINFLRKIEVEKAVHDMGQQNCKPDFIIIDTLARAAIGGDENSAKDMGVFIDEVERLKRSTGATLLIIHHTTKDGKTERGSSAIRGAVDASIECVKSNGMLALKCKKMRVAREFPELAVKLAEVVVETTGRAESTLAVAGRGSILDLEPSEIGRNEDRALKVLSDKFPEGAAYTQWQEAYCADNGQSKPTFDRALKNIRLAGAVEERVEGKRAKYFVRASISVTSVSNRSHETNQDVVSESHPL